MITKRQRGNVQKKDIRNVPGQNTALNGSANSDGLVGVDRLVRVLAIEEVTVELLDERNTGRAAGKDNSVPCRPSSP